MNYLKKLLKTILFTIQVTLILLYLLLEELVWERFAAPIFKYIKYSKPFEKLEKLLNRTNRYIVLTVFIISLIIGEGFGILSPIIAIKGYPTLAIAVYGLKLIIAAFAFWVLNTQKRTLLSFKWFAYLYEKFIFIINWIKDTKIYKSVVETLKIIKKYLKQKYQVVKSFIFSKF